MSTIVGAAVLSVSLALLLQTCQAQRLSLTEHRRASVSTPRAPFVGRSSGDAARVLNRLIKQHAHSHGHRVISCEQLIVNETLVENTVLGLSSFATLDEIAQIALQPSQGHLAEKQLYHGPAMHLHLMTSFVQAAIDEIQLKQVYQERNDRRRLRYASAEDLKRQLTSTLKTLLALRASENPAARTAELAWRDGLCYEASMIYVHHLSSDTKRRRLPASTVVPLLPMPERAEALSGLLDQHRTEASERAVQPQGKPASDVDTDIGTLDSILQVVEDQVVCSRCHVRPDSTFSPQQNTYVSKALRHEPLGQPQVRASSHGVLSTTLTVNTSRIHGPLSFDVRSFEGMTPGPTLRVKPGDRIKIRLRNNLDKDSACTANHRGDGPQSNLFRCPNVTNLHLHGLWVQPHDVFSGVFPGEEVELVYDIPADHAAGTNWYHPHFHGSVSLQLANGMAGALIVEDTPETLPKELAAMNEAVMLLQSVAYFNYTSDDVTCPHSHNLSRCHNLDGAGSLSTMRSFSHDAMPLNMSITDDRAGNPIPGNYFIVNGQYQPVVSMKPGEWQRWRIINGAPQASVSLAVDGCEVVVIARDGVYLSSPRRKSVSQPVVLPPGSRADVTVSCNTIGTYWLQSFENPDVYNLGQQEGYYSGVLAIVNVSGAPTKGMQAPSRLPKLPSYLSDTRQATVFNRHTVQWDLLRLINNTAGNTDVPIYGVTAQPFEWSTINQTCVPMNSGDGSDDGVAEWTIVNPIWICNGSVDHCLWTMDRQAASRSAFDAKGFQEPVSLSHGFHMHTFKFQVVNDSNGGSSFDYEIGDWRDTVSTPLAGSVVVRWWPSQFEGMVPFHCHMTPHSDRGMLGVAQVTSSCPADPWTPRLTNYSMPITTTSQRAQHLFDEGLQLCFGFAHEAAIRFFQESIRQDPYCAMCHWGAAYANGPVINVPICDSPACDQGAREAQLAVDLAKQQAANLTEKEAFLIAAMSLRYSNDPEANLTQHFVQYAIALNDTAMVSSDPDIASLYAEAVMMYHAQPGQYLFYDDGGKPYPEIRQTTGVLERALKLPAHGLGGMHPLVEHLYIHITEPSSPGYGNMSAGRAIDEADDFLARFNGTQLGHIQHMSGHVYLRVGEYGKVVDVNRVAHASDAAWLSNELLPYGPGHNLAFLIYGACMDGQSKVAKDFGETLRSVYRAAPDRPDGPGPDQAWNLPLTTFVRFGEFNEILKGPDAFDMPRDWPYQRVLAYYALGTAQAQTGDVNAAVQSLQQINVLARPMAGRYANYTHIAELGLKASIAVKKNDSHEAIRLLQAAAEEQDSWPYDEPPDWHMPMRQCLGQVLLQTQDFAGADKEFRKDLFDYPNNGWSLFGLLSAMKHQPQKYSKADIDAVASQLKKSWTRADVELVTSCYAVMP